MQITKKQALHLIMVCVRLARDKFNEFANLDLVKGKNRAEKLIVFEAFNDFDKSFSRLLGKEEFSEINQIAIDNADSIEWSLDSIYNSFYSELVTKLSYDCIDLSAKGLVVRYLLLTGNGLWNKMFAKDNVKIKNILERMTQFESHIKVNCLNEDFTIDVTKAYRFMNTFLDNLFNTLNHE